MTRSLAVTLNALGLYAIALVLAAAFAAQLLLDELPCPLCLLQRIQFALLAVGPVLNVRLGPRPSHYAASLLVAVAYTWAFIGFAAAIALIAGMLLFDRQFEDGGSAPPVAVGAFALRCHSGLAGQSPRPGMTAERSARSLYPRRWRSQLAALVAKL